MMKKGIQVHLPVHPELQRAHADRFRHTLATEILEDEGSIEDAATMLGNSPLVIRKHYAVWTAKCQERISSLMQAVFLAHFWHTVTLRMAWRRFTDRHCRFSESRNAVSVSGMRQRIDASSFGLTTSSM